MHQIKMSELIELESEIASTHSNFCTPKRKLSNPHQYIIQAKTILEKCEPRYGRYPYTLHDYSHTYLSIQVTKATLPKALRAFDCFIKLAEARSHQVRVDSHSTKILIGEIECKIRIRETFKRVEAANNSYQTYDYVPTGLLCFSIDELYKKEWNDKSKALEFRWARIMAYLELRAKGEMEWKIECAKKQVEYERQRLIQEEEKLKEAIEKEKLNQLLKDSSNWQKAELIRNYVKESGVDQIQDQDWIMWALSKADEIDPTVSI